MFRDNKKDTRSIGLYCSKKTHKTVKIGKTIAAIDRHFINPGLIPILVVQEQLVVVMNYFSYTAMIDCTLETFFRQFLFMFCCIFYFSILVLFKDNNGFQMNRG